MKRLIRVAVRLYPAWWRRRYAREFEALLEDITPGWRELFDVLNGALTMQIKTLGTIPVVCALAGAIAGGIIALRAPVVFASSATIHLTTRDIPGAESATKREFRVPVERALGASNASKKATLVSYFKSDSAESTLKLTYLDRDPAQAQRLAETLTAAIANEYSERAVSTKVIEAAGLPTVPVTPNYPVAVAVGGGVGLVAGSVVFLVLRSRRRPGT